METTRQKRVVKRFRLIKIVFCRALFISQLILPLSRGTRWSELLENNRKHEWKLKSLLYQVALLSHKLKSWRTMNLFTFLSCDRETRMDLNAMRA